ncbi:hypothetical protein AHAS_Ahas12G0276200 [Arachis hypogaea]
MLLLCSLPGQSHRPSLSLSFEAHSSGRASLSLSHSQNIFRELQSLRSWPVFSFMEAQKWRYWQTEPDRKGRNQIKLRILRAMVKPL